jgi:hypothetical protein
MKSHIVATRNGENWRALNLPSVGEARKYFTALNNKWFALSQSIRNIRSAWSILQRVICLSTYIMAFELRNETVTIETVVIKSRYLWNVAALWAQPFNETRAIALRYSFALMHSLLEKWGRWKTIGST